MAHHKVRFFMGFDMKIYLIAAIITMIGGAYFFGVQITRTECSARLAQAQTAATQENEKITRIVNEKTVHTAVRDIRNILRTKYTITD